MISLNRTIEITQEQRRTCFFQVSCYGLTGDNFESVTFLRESVYLDANGAEIKRVQDSTPFEFTPETISQAPDLAAAIETIYAYMDQADLGRLQAESEAD